MRRGLRLLLETQPGFTVVAEASDGLEAVEKAQTTSPGVAVLDIAMPDLNGVEAAQRIHEMLPDTAIVILSMHSDEGYVLRALRAGARGYLTSREREILHLLAQGKSNKEIASLWNLSTYTVETHRRNLQEKLNLRNFADLVLYAVRKGITS
jgi:DNA-binding NarL/FixJ family response regulator